MEKIDAVVCGIGNSEIRGHRNNQMSRGVTLQEMFLWDKVKCACVWIKCGMCYHCVP